MRRAMHSPSMRRRFTARVAGTFVLALACVGAAPAATPPHEWSFTVRLDGTPIGTHRFELDRVGTGELSLSSEARLDVRLLGVPLYRYRHRAAERWTGGCLASVEARTDDNGRLTEVEGRELEGRFDLTVRQDDRLSSPQATPARCMMSFAYWNPALADQKRLLDPGSGRVEPVVITATGAAPADLQPQAVRGLRIGGLAHPIDVWYVGDRWVGLDTVVGGGRRLSYRLR